MFQAQIRDGRAAVNTKVKSSLLQKPIIECGKRSHDPKPCREITPGLLLRDIDLYSGLDSVQCEKNLAWSRVRSAFHGRHGLAISSTASRKTQ